MKPGIDFPGVGAGLVIRRDGKVLLYKRVNPPEAGHWNIVGGKVDHMEHSRIAAIREAEEETGLSIGPIDFLGMTEQILHDENQHWFSLLYVTHVTQGEPQLTEPDKLSEIGWFDLDALPAPLSRFAAVAVSKL